ncbi:MAG: hemolysin family protein [Treponemataceae bacterium]|nr:hemolysin family protein [Treponemataceae bacterium]
MSALKTAATVAALVLIIFAVAFFAGSETAYLSISRIKMRRLVQERRRNASLAAKLHGRMDELLTVVLIGTNFMNSLASALATALAISVVGTGGVGIATAVITFFATTFGQIVPKTVAGVYPNEVACRNAFALAALEKCLFPVVWLFSRISRFASAVAERFWKADAALVTEEELKALIEIGETEGTLEAGERAMLSKIFKFNDLDVHDIMEHRTMIRGVPADAGRRQVVELFRETGLSKLPVFGAGGGSEAIVGVIYYKAVLTTSEKSAAGGAGYASAVMDDVLFVPETFTALELLQRFRKEKTDFAVALDEQGCTAGIATMDDILRVVFGRMTDESASDVPPESRIRLLSQNECIVPGDMKIDDVNDILKLGIESEEFTTLGGWLLEQFGRLPSAGEMLVWNHVLFTVEDQAQRRILSVRIMLRVPKARTAGRPRKA